MTEHLPECQPESVPDPPFICICPELRACEDRAIAAAVQRVEALKPQLWIILVDVVGFLRSWLPRLAVDFLPVDDLAREVRQCYLRAQRAANAAPSHGYRVACPAPEDGGDCGRMLVINGQDLDDEVTCRSCGTTWSVDRLLVIVAGEVTGAIWMDGEAAAQRAGVDVRTLRRWAASGLVRRDHGRYDLKEIQSMAGSQP